MNTRTSKVGRISAKFSDKEFRDCYVDSHITNGLSFQIRGMRKSRKLSQQELAVRLGTKQEAISRLENPDYGKFSLDTLKKIGSEFDVALSVRFISFSELAAQTTSMTKEMISVPAYKDDDGLNNWCNIPSVQYIDESFKEKPSSLLQKRIVTIVSTGSAISNG